MSVKLLALDEFTAALRDAFPEANVTKAMTWGYRLGPRHTATVALHGVEFSVWYKVNERTWDSRWSNMPSVATAAELRPSLVSDARHCARSALTDAQKFAAVAEQFTIASKLIESGL